mmetsp:Transcript_39184/g.59785  ORF Transcript_39184/g.59785 Transcript_39184/m.59785 type:complete len:117 (-) Transcript_39184:210-560(-)
MNKTAKERFFAQPQSQVIDDRQLPPIIKPAKQAEGDFTSHTMASRNEKKQRSQVVKIFLTQDNVGLKSLSNTKSPSQAQRELSLPFDSQRSKPKLKKNKLHTDKHSERRKRSPPIP